MKDCVMEKFNNMKNSFTTAKKKKGICETKFNKLSKNIEVMKRAKLIWRVRSQDEIKKLRWIKMTISNEKSSSNIVFPPETDDHSHVGGDEFDKDFALEFKINMKDPGMLKNFIKGNECKTSPGCV